MYKLFLALRYLRKRRITYFAVLSVALCTAMVLGVHSVMSSFLENVKQSSRQLLGDISIEIGSMSTFPLYDEFIATMHQALGERLAAATPVVFNAGWVTLLVGRNDERTFPVLATGIRLEEYVRVNRLAEGLYYARYFPGTTTLEAVRKPLMLRDADGAPRLPADLEAALLNGGAQPAPRLAGQMWPGPGVFKESEPLAEDSGGYSGEACPGMILGVGLVADRGPGGEFKRTVPRGTLARLTVLPHHRFGPADSALGRTAPFRYVDDARSQVHDIDSRSAYVDFAELQKLLELNGTAGTLLHRPRAAQIQIRLGLAEDPDLACDQIRRLWLDFVDAHAPELSLDDADDMYQAKVQTWRQRNAGFIRAVEKQRVLVLILLCVISAVAVVLVGCTFYMIAQERTAEVGIIKGMGAGRAGAAGVFLAYAVGVGVVGSLAGIFIGALFVHYINDIQAWLAALHPALQIWTPEVYAFERIPNRVLASDAAVIMGVGILAAVVGATAAALKAANVWPTRALHYR